MHVMIAVDNSESAHAVAESAVAVFGAAVEYTVVSIGSELALESMSMFAGQPMMFAFDNPEYLHDTRAASEEIVDEVAEDLHLPDVHRVADVGPPGPSICALAEDRNVDIIVVGGRERGWLSRLVDPSVTKYIVEHAPCHVLVLRHLDDEAD